jgi:hypothetical protein
MFTKPKKREKLSTKIGMKMKLKRTLDIGWIRGLIILIYHSFVKIG